MSKKQPKFSEMPDAEKAKKFLELREVNSVSEWIYSICKTYKTGPESIKEPLKIAVCGLIDNIVRSISPVKKKAKEDSSEKLSEQVKKRLERKKQINSRPNTQLSSTYKAISHKKMSSIDSAFFRTKEECASFSEFGHKLNSPSFTTAERKLCLAHVGSPGPAHYHTFSSSFAVSPSPRIPTDRTRRDKFLYNENTTGPGDYFPSKHYISK